MSTNIINTEEDMNIKQTILISDFQYSPAGIKQQISHSHSPTADTDTSVSENSNTWRSVASHGTQQSHKPKDDAVSPITPYFERLATIVSVGGDSNHNHSAVNNNNSSSNNMTHTEDSRDEQQRRSSEHKRHIDTIKKALNSTSSPVTIDLMSDMSTDSIEKKNIAMQELNLINSLFGEEEDDEQDGYAEQEIPPSSSSSESLNHENPTHNFNSPPPPSSTTTNNNNELTQGKELSEIKMSSAINTTNVNRDNEDDEHQLNTNDHDATVDSINAIVDSTASSRSTPQQTPSRDTKDVTTAGIQQQQQQQDTAAESTTVNDGIVTTSTNQSDPSVLVPLSTTNTTTTTNTSALLPPRSPTSRHNKSMRNNANTNNNISPTGIRLAPSPSFSTPSSANTGTSTGQPRLYAPAYAGNNPVTSNHSSSSNSLKSSPNESPSQMIQRAPNQSSRVAYRVVIQSADNLTHTGRKTSPFPSAYCTIYLVDAKGRSCVGFSSDCQTHVEKNSDHPSWNKQFVLRLTESYSGRPPAG